MGKTKTLFALGICYEMKFNLHNVESGNIENLHYLQLLVGI